MTEKLNRRDALKAAGAAALLGALPACEREARPPAAAPSGGGRPVSPDEEYVWISARANLPLFVAHDHPALHQAARELGVNVTIAGPEGLDVPGLVAAIEQTSARRPAGIMVVGWDPSALVAPIDSAIERGVPVVCVDADVPASRRMAFVGTDWHHLGVRQGEEMLRALKGRKGRVAMLGLIEQSIDQEAFAGFRSVVEPAGIDVLEPVQDKGSQIEAARVAAALIQAHPDLVGMAGFDSESGPGIGQAILEARKTGQIVATCVEAEAQHLELIRNGVLTAAIRQKRELFTYYGLKALFEAVHATIRFTPDDRKIGLVPIPVRYDTGTFTVDRENVEFFIGA